MYTNLFPARHTWYLLGTIIILNGIDWAGFELLSIGNKKIESLPTEYRVLDGLFQALGMINQRKAIKIITANMLYQSGASWWFLRSNHCRSSPGPPGSLW